MVGCHSGTFLFLYKERGLAPHPSGLFAHSAHSQLYNVARRVCAEGYIGTLLFCLSSFCYLLTLITKRMHIKLTSAESLCQELSEAPSSTSLDPGISLLGWKSEITSSVFVSMQS